MAATEADTCREYVTPALQEAGWALAPYAIGEQRTIAPGRIVLVGGKARRAAPKRADYVLFYRRDFPIAVVEAKEASLPAENGTQQARDYAQLLGLKFAYATNGHRIDYLAGTEREISRYPTPGELWSRLSQASGFAAERTAPLLEPYNLVSGKVPRYYQDIAIHRVIEAIMAGRTRVLATLATGTGKTSVAFQVCWKLWNSRWNRQGEYRRPKILFLADRNILVDDPKDRDFIHFGDARHKISGGDPSQARDMYFGIYQALSTASEDVFRQYRPDFFDLVIIDECHRGAARDDSSWRKVLDYFAPAVHFGMTATPLRDDSRDTYDYFGDPVYTYSLRQGIEDGFLAPYRVHRVITTADAAGWRPNRNELDRYGREIPDDEYQTKDFERVVALRARTKAMAKHLSDFLRGTDRFAKTLVFCVDQEHAAEFRQELVASSHPKQKMAELVTLRPTDVAVDQAQQYRFAGVHSFGRGVFASAVKGGGEFAYERLSTVRSGDFTYPKLMAWEGALGVVPSECDGMVVSPEFPVFSVNRDVVLPEVLDIYFRAPSIWPELAALSGGTNLRMTTGIEEPPDA